MSLEPPFALSFTAVYPAQPSSTEIIAMVTGQHADLRFGVSMSQTQPVESCTPKVPPVIRRLKGRRGRSSFRLSMCRPPETWFAPFGLHCRPSSTSVLVNMNHQG